MPRKFDGMRKQISQLQERHQLEQRRRAGFCCCGHPMGFITDPEQKTPEKCPLCGGREPWFIRLHLVCVDAQGNEIPPD